MTAAEVECWIADMKRLGTPGSVTACQHCGVMTLYLFSKKYSQARPPLTCGKWICGAKCGEPWGKGYVRGH